MNTANATEVSKTPNWKANDDSAVMNIGTRRELFVDEHLIDHFKKAARLKLHHPRREEVAITFNRPWEGNISLHAAIIAAGNGYRMYYRGRHMEGGPGNTPTDAVVCLAESDDGLEWRRVNVGLIEHKGSTDNNIVWKGEGSSAFTPMLDANPDARPEAKYKAIAKTKDERGRRLAVFQSPDGLRWEKMRDVPILTHENVSPRAFDSQNVAFWDAEREEYRIYFRDWVDNRVRGIKTATSQNFLDWTEPEWIEWNPEAPLVHLYTNAVQPYPRAPHLLVGFPTRYHPDRGEMVEPLLMTSRDGRTFRRWENALIRPGRNADRWFNRSNYVETGFLLTPSPLPGEERELSILTNEGYYRGEDTRLRRYSYRLDGFVSLHASAEGGEVITKPFIFEGARLCLNYSTAVAGHVRVEIQDTDCNPIEGFTLDDMPPVYGDALDQVFSWNGRADISKLAGQPIRLRFELKDADVFAFQFTR